MGRSKDEEELKRLKEKQMKRKEIRAEQERKLNQEKKLEEERLKKIEAEKRAELEEQKKKAMQEASDGKGKGPAIDAHKEISKTKEQVEAEMKISLSFRIKPLDLEAMDSDELKDKATELFNTILLLETEKYDCEQRRINQDYELKELKERQKVQLTESGQEGS